MLFRSISDGLSAEILVRDFSKIYNGVKLDKMSLSYIDFAYWQTDFFESEPFKRQETFWLNNLAGDVNKLKLPYDYDLPLIQSYEGKDYTVEVNAASIKTLSRKSNCTEFMFFLSVFNILLSKYTGQDEITIGSPVSGRSNSDTQGMVGLFVNTLIHRNQVNPDMPFNQYLNLIKESTIQVLDNADYPYELLVEKLNIRRNESRNAIFDVMFDMGSEEKLDADRKSVV